jgi:hypothetical protein
MAAAVTSGAAAGSALTMEANTAAAAAGFKAIAALIAPTAASDWSFGRVLRTNVSARAGNSAGETASKADAARFTSARIPALAAKPVAPIAHAIPPIFAGSFFMVFRLNRC